MLLLSPAWRHTSGCTHPAARSVSVPEPSPDLLHHALVQIKKSFSSSCSYAGREPDYSPEALADQVDWSSLPGAEKLEVKDGFKMFSGYINVDADSGRNIFYWFMEAQDKPEDAPVVSAVADLESASKLNFLKSTSCCTHCCRYRQRVALSSVEAWRIRRATAGFRRLPE